MFQTLLFPFRLLFFIVLTVFRVIGFFLGISVRTARLMAGSFLVLGIGVLLGLFLGRKINGSTVLSHKRNGPAH